MDQTGTGRFFNGLEEARANDQAYDPEARRCLAIYDISRYWRIYARKYYSPGNETRRYHLAGWAMPMITKDFPRI